MTNLSTVDKILLVIILLVLIGVSCWMVSQGYVTGAIVYAVVSSILTATVGILFHSAGAASALATPTAPVVVTTTTSSAPTQLVKPVS